MEAWKGQNERIIVSMSSFPVRMTKLEDAIKTLSEQSLKPDQIYVHVPKHIERLNLTNIPLPDHILALEDKYPLMKIIINDVDYGASTKLLGTLQIEKDPNTIVITVDDDTTYHKHTVKALVQNLQQHPNTAPCFVCQIWQNDRAEFHRVSFFNDRMSDHA